MLLCKQLRFGAELVELYKSDVVSECLGKHVESEKCIYQQDPAQRMSVTVLCDTK